jgi:hypothetical protein
MVTVEQYEQAEREATLADSRRGFRIHAAVYALVNIGLITLNTVLIVTTDAGFPWFVFPLVGWGIGLTFHYLYGVRWVGDEVRKHQEDVERHVRSRDLAA